jgi:hypothetical protein
VGGNRIIEAVEIRKWQRGEIGANEPRKLYEDSDPCACSAYTDF